MKRATTETVTGTEIDTADVHEARALMAGKDECRCALCKRVRRHVEQLRASGRSYWNLTPSEVSRG